MANTDHKTLEEFVRALAKATAFKSHPLGYEDSIDARWKDEAGEWVKVFDSPGDPCYCDDADSCNCGQEPWQ